MKSNCSNQIRCHTVLNMKEKIHCTDGENQIHFQLHRPCLSDEKYQLNKLSICCIQAS